MDFCIDVALHQLQKEVKPRDDGETVLENLTISPLGMCVILHMIVNGAQGDTLEQLLQCLKVEKKEESISKASILAEISKSSSSSPSENNNPDDLTIGNFNFVLLMKDILTLKKDHQDFLERVYQAKFQHVDFDRQEEAIEEVNLWVESETKGLIKQLLTNDAFDSRELALIHANALYFNGKWEQEFHPNNTSMDTFHLLNPKMQIINVPFMREYETDYDYASFDDYQVLRMPYKTSDGASRRFSMTILLPREIKGLPDVVEKFRENPELLSSENLNLKKERIETLMIPRFKHFYSHNPIDSMKELGLTLPFIRGNKDLQGMVEKTDVKLFVSRIFQHIEVECNEQGTEVVCCTREEEDDDMGFSILHDLPPPPPPIEFIADHPFMFMIKEDVSDTIFFLGAICKPISEVLERYHVLHIKKPKKHRCNDGEFPEESSDDDMGYSLFSDHDDDYNYYCSNREDNKHRDSADKSGGEIVISLFD